MTKFGGGGENFDWQQAAMDEQAEAADVPGHVNVNYNVNIDFTPPANGDYTALIDALEKLFGK